MSEGIKLTERQQNDGQSNLNFGLFLVIESIIYSVKSTEKLHAQEPENCKKSIKFSKNALSINKLTNILITFEIRMV